MSQPAPPGGVPEVWLLDALGDGVVLLDAGWRVVYLNAAAERLLDAPRESLVGRVVGTEIPEPPPERMAVYRRAMETRRMERLHDVQVGGRVYDAEVHPSPEGGIALVFREITERRRAEQAATRLGRILESSWNEVYIFDAASLHFVQVSRGARENLGYEEAELASLTPLDLLPEHTPDSFAALLAPLAAGEQPQLIFEAMLRRRDLSLYPAEVRLQLSRGELVPVYIALVLDISGRKQAQEQLEAQALELEVLNQELRQQTAELASALASRNRFYAAMSHELRTPINAILGYNDLILTGVYGPVEERQREGVERAQRAARHLLEIVNDVLDVSRLEAGKVEVLLEEVRLAETLEELTVTARPLAERHGSPLRLEVDGCPQTVVTDPRRVRQIVLNLLSNAAKFGEGKPIELRCAGAPDGGAVVEVVDQGVGIAPGDQERIFDEFVQLRPTDEGYGTGLGLTISRGLAALLGGTLTVRSAPGRGSTFRLALPPRIPDPPPAKS